MKRLVENPFVAFPLGVALAMMLGVAWSLGRDDRLVVNEIFVVYVLALPLLAGGYAFLVRESWRRRLGIWIGTAVLGSAAAFVVFFASGILIPYERVSVYNYPHFHYSYYLAGAERRVTSGGQALDETLYTLDGKQVQLADLWNARPIVFEFGSIT